MLVLHVYVRVKPEAVEAFKAATLDNARSSAKEPGIDRFDVLQDLGDPTRFTLIEAYRSPEAIDAHKLTSHYHAWRETVVDMMAEPRTSAKSEVLFWTK